MDFDIITSSLKKGWEVWKNNAVAYVVGLLLIFVLTAVIWLIAGFLGIGAMLTGVVALIAGVGTSGLAFTGMGIVAMILAFIVSILIVAPLLLGTIHMAIKGARGDKVEIKDVFYSFNKGRYVRILIFIIVYAIIFMILNIIPVLGQILAIIVQFLLVFSFYIYMMVPSQNVVYALKESFNTVKDNFLVVLVAYIVYIILIIIGSLLLGIGLLVTLPIAMIMMATILTQLRPDIKDASGN